MSSPKPASKPGKNKTWDQYVAEAKGEPFVLPVGEDQRIEIPRPTGDQMFAAEAATSSKDILRALCGDKYDEVLELFAGADAAVMRAVMNDIQEHFGLGN
jgi:hypothetical protein